MFRYLILAIAATSSAIALGASDASLTGGLSQQQDSTGEVAEKLADAWHLGDAQTVKQKLAELERLAEQAKNTEAQCHLLFLVGRGWRDYSVLATEKVDALKAAIPHLEKAVELNPKHAEARALLANVLRRLVGAGERDTETIHKAMEHREKAYQLAPENPVVLMFEATALISIPEDRGGDINQGVATGFEAIGRFQLEDKADTEQNVAETWAMIGSGYRKQKQNDLSLKAYEKALEAQPNWKAIRENIIPNLKNSK